MGNSAIDSGLVPTRVRYRVIGMLGLLAMVTYLDRACIATLAPNITKDLGLNKAQMSWVYSAFGLAYAFFEIPTAWWADRKGTRLVLTRIVLWWSAWTMMTGAAFSYLQLLVTRFLFGAGEAGAWPSVARTFSRWIPLKERGRVQGVFFCGAHLAGGLTPVLVIFLNSFLRWRFIFLLFGIFGACWSIAWYRWFRNDPSEHSRVNAAEAAKIAEGRGPMAAGHAGWEYWRRALGHPNILPLCLSYVPNSVAFYFCITWLPTMLSEKYAFKAMSLGLAAGSPLILSMVGDLFGGMATDTLSRRFGLRIGRATVGITGNLVAGLAMIGAGFAKDPHLAVALVSISVASTMFTLGAQWSTCQDIGGSHVGVVSAMMNTTGQLGSIFGPPIVTALLAHFGNWNAPIFAIGCTFLVATICWLFIDPNKKVFN
ncbi:MAG: sauU 5 [Verrucomicrobiales bacterium]|nr:sauU 5 [Verrucomicrobiales bacterium]